MHDEPTPGERTRVIRVVKRQARNSDEEAELIAMLGLDRTEPAPPKHRSRGALSAAELHDMLAPFAAERVRRYRRTRKEQE
ncbi:hypothetical protein H4696_002852 [Amycolatopsis lexingtonensis]|uniref:Uncharacterized protein n=1 Tax=Amycolatopsis lexingtonensis TaxID=218822 RepID=A0ABR9HXV1_9PSEU|nr:hypothetical protein [Amycolatopsis lexingtonensis]MBE1495752.1 hypothetical protein [Amycolatopsis lexingtonensis]